MDAISRDIATNGGNAQAQGSLSLKPQRQRPPLPTRHFESGRASSTGPCGFRGGATGSKLDRMYSFAVVS